MNPRAELIVSDLAHVLLLVALLSHLGGRLLGGLLGPRQGALIGFAIGALLAILPEGISPVFYTRALIGDPGALSWTFLLVLLMRSVWQVEFLPRREARALALVAVVGAIAIYPGSLGVPGMPDFYKADFGGGVLPSATLGFALFSIWRGFPVAAATASLGLVLYGMGLHESANLWDCLIDFPSVVVAVVILVRWGWSFRRLREETDAASLPASPGSP